VTDRPWGSQPRLKVVNPAGGEVVEWPPGFSMLGLRGTCRLCGAKAVVISAMRGDGTAQTRCEACGHTVEFEPGEL